jgi:TPR repeat protein
MPSRWHPNHCNGTKVVVVPKTILKPLDYSSFLRIRGTPQHKTTSVAFYQTGRGGLPKDDREAVRLFKLAADQGAAAGQASLGLACLSGLGGMLKDEREAVRLFKLSADQGNALGQVNLGFAYERALGGLPKDEREAVRLYKLAADQGNAAAQSSLARVNGARPAPK